MGRPEERTESGMEIPAPFPERFPVYAIPDSAFGLLWATRTTHAQFELRIAELRVSWKAKSADGGSISPLRTARFLGAGSHGDSPCQEQLISWKSPPICPSV
jgi:hypothetical protein